MDEMIWDFRDGRARTPPRTCRTDSHLDMTRIFYHFQDLIDDHGTTQRATKIEALEIRDVSVLNGHTNCIDQLLFFNSLSA